MRDFFKRTAGLLALPTIAIFILITGVGEGGGVCIAQDRSMALQLGQNLVVGLPGAAISERTEALLRRIRPGGIVLYSRNYQSVEQLKGFIARLQAISREETGQPYFIMIDEEPQGATRVGLLTNVFVLGLPDWQKIQRNVKVLSEMGINVNLAPLADYPFNDNSFIKRRMPVGDNEENLIQFNRTFIDLLRSHGILSTVKHFPGLGILEDDPHKKIPNSYVSGDILRRSLSIFRSGFESGAGFVMTGHAIYENIDRNNPATFSSVIVRDLLRKQLKFEGLVITDDLSDMPLKNYDGLDTAGAAIRSIKAGHTMVVLSHNLQKTSRIYNEMLVHMSKDKDLQAAVLENYSAIVDFKRTFLENADGESL